MTIPGHIQRAIQAYYAERATPDDIAALEDWFREDEANVRVFAEHGLIEWHMLCEQEKSDAAAILAILREAEENAEPDYSLLSPPAQASPSPKPDHPPITVRELFSIAGYLVAQGLRTRAGVYNAIAATLVIAGVLFFTILAPPSDPISQPITTNTQNEPGRPGPENPSQDPAPVATLTATHNAQWAPGPAASAARANPSQHPPSTGDKLHPNQRLTLTAGFAEITTARGAIALLQAPATIELLNNDNALRLHTGKLLGICETESSKGFVVRTPHVDVTDLGTHFGVDATQTWATEVHVFDGKVAVGGLDAPADTEPTSLLAGQSVRATGINDAILSIDHDIDRFAAMLPAAIPLPGTGQGLAAGEIDPRWTVIAVDGKELDTSPPVRVFDEPETRGHGPREAQWIGLKTNGEDSVLGQGQTVVIQTQFWIPSTADTGACTLQMRFIADYRLLSLVVNGQKIGVPPNRLHSKISEMVVSEHLIHGANSIRFEIQDDARPRGVNYVGLRASWQLHTKNATP